MGHTSCGAIKTAVDFACSQKTTQEATGLDGTNLDLLINEIKHSINHDMCKNLRTSPPLQKEIYANEVAYRNIFRSIRLIRERSPILDQLVKEGKIAIVGAMYDITHGEVSFFQTKTSSANPLTSVATEA